MRATASTSDDAAPPSALLPPSTAIELRMYGALETLGIRFWPQRDVGPYRVDAYLPGWALALEADGCPYHACASCGYGEDAWARQRGRRRDRALLQRHGVLALHIWGHALRSEGEALESVRRALAPYVWTLGKDDAE